MNSFSVCLSLIPVTVYLLIFGFINIFSRPKVLNGTYDSLLLCIGVSGMIFVGPMSLFYPVNAAVQFGNYVWIFLVTLYVLISVLVILLQRPRLIVYNINPVLFKSLIADIVNRLDPQSRWAGESVFLLKFNLSFHLETQKFFNNVSLISNTSQSNRTTWSILETVLKSELATQKSERNPWGFLFFFVAFLLLGLCVFTILS